MDDTLLSGAANGDRVWVECERRSDNHSARLLPLHQILVHGMPTPRHKFERLGEQDLPAPSLGDVHDADAGALRPAAGL